MPTLLQLPNASSISSIDEVLIQHGTVTSSVTVGTLLAGTQPLISLSSGSLMGRASALPGGPESLAIGSGLNLQAGTLSASPISVSGDLTGGGAGTLVLSLPSITTPGSFSKVTVNAKGQVVGGGAVNGNDVTAALGYTPYSNTNPAGYLTSTALVPLAPLANPAFTGTPTAPTPQTTDNSNAVATTAFVQSHSAPMPTIAAGLSVFRAIDFGAKFDGVHDDQPGLTAAIAATHANGGGIVLLPAGRGMLANTLLQPYSNVHLVGVGVANPFHLTSSGFDACTSLTWTGTPGGTMLVVGPVQNTQNGQNISNADVRGVMLDCAGLAGSALVIQSVQFSEFDVGYSQPLQVGIRVTTVFLQAQQSASLGAVEINDTQHNQFKISGAAINYTASTVSSAVPVGGSPNVSVASAAGFVPQMQVRVGRSLYLLQSVAGTTLTFTSPVSAADGVSGAPVSFAPRGVWIHGATSDLLPLGVFAVGGTTPQKYPSAWIGNVSLNQFRSVVLFHYNGGDGLTFGYSDHNYVDKALIYSAANGIGVIFDGSNVSGMSSGNNRINYCSAGSIVARGTSSYTYPAAASEIEYLDSSNGTGFPIVEPGATVYIRNDFGVAYSPKLVAPVIYDTGWEPITGTSQPAATTSLTVMNNSADHIRLATPLSATPVWSIALNAQNLSIASLAGTGGILLGQGAAVTILGPITAGSTLGLSGTSTFGGLASFAGGATFGAAVNLNAGVPLTLGSNTGSSLLFSNGPAGGQKLTVYQTAGVGRWWVGSSSDAESGGNAGSSYIVAGFDDHGTYLNTWLTIARGTGAVSMPGAVSVGGALTAPTPVPSDSSINVATTSWVTAKGYVTQTANLASLRAVATSSLADGTVMLADAYSTRGDNGGGLFTWNASSIASDNGGTVIKPTAVTGAGRWLRQLGSQRVIPQMFGAKGDGLTDDTAAFNAALAAGPIYVPAAIYIIANVIVPNGALIEGDVGLGYTGDIAAGTPTAIQQLTPVRPVLLAKPGTTGCLLNVNGNIDAIIKGVFLDGGANSATCDGISAGSTRLTMERVTVVRCINGLGSVAGAADVYTHVATVIDCEFANNTNGVSNIIDSVMIAGAVSANVVGVNLGSGANANNFIGMRFEWNYQDGLQGYQASSNQVIGGLFDRNSWRGVNLGSGCADWTFTGVQFARNGVANTYPNNSHVALNGTTSVFFTGCITRTGRDDNNAGVLSPAYVVNYINTNALVTISSCDISGFVTSAFFGPNPAAYVQRDNQGGGDTIVTAARPYIGSGVVAQTLVTKAAANIAPGVATSIPIGQSPLTNNYSVTSRELVVTATNFNTPFQSCSARFNLAFYRDTAVHAPGASSAYGEAGGTGVMTWGGSGKLQLSANSIATDGSTWTLGILNGGSADGSNWGVWAELH